MFIGSGGPINVARCGGGKTMEDFEGIGPRDVPFASHISKKTS